MKGATRSPAAATGAARRHHTAPPSGIPILPRPPQAEKYRPLPRRVTFASSSRTPSRMYSGWDRFSDSLSTNFALSLTPSSASATVISNICSFHARWPRVKRNDNVRAAPPSSATNRVHTAPSLGTSSTPRNLKMTCGRLSCCTDRKRMTIRGGAAAMSLGNRHRHHTPSTTSESAVASGPCRRPTGLRLRRRQRAQQQHARVNSAPYSRPLAARWTSMCTTAWASFSASDSSTEDSETSSRTSESESACAIGRPVQREVYLRADHRGGPGHPAAVELQTMTPSRALARRLMRPEVREVEYALPRGRDGVPLSLSWGIRITPARMPCPPHLDRRPCSEASHCVSLLRPGHLSRQIRDEALPHPLRTKALDKRRRRTLYFFDDSARIC
ncbi:hypothetical protein B0H17DRAFT_1201355 [Mycena rosella]|uniref:Uncharacterized protein n=1 Tax=Mycena rosella TaxID=1033263 RepID=A0AAD7DIH5_MYCRO|nr:hypothetical protein B0H17DRAFT_1201355 [Mycena rosella]